MSQLGNPIAIAAGTQAANKAVDKASNFVENNSLAIVGTLAAIYAWYKIPPYLKRKRAERYARKNIGHPVVTAAAIIHESFSRLGARTGFLSFLIPEFDIFTDEAALMDIASKIDNIGLVAKAYQVLFDRDLFTDTLNGLSTAELNAFYNTIQAPSYNSNPQIEHHYLLGDMLYCAKKTRIQVPIVEKQDDDSWLTTQALYGNFNHKQLIGEIEATGIHEQENKRYYIVKNCFIWGYGCNYGIVWADQVTNEIT